MSVSQIKKQMKLNFITTSVLLGLCAVLVFSCSKDDEYEDFYSLDINSHTPATRSSMNDYWESGNNAYTQLINNNKEYISQANCCGLTTIVDAWMRKKKDSYFGTPNCKTAQNFYDELVLEVTNNNKYNWTPDSATMPLSTFLMLVEKFPLSTSKQKDGSITTKYIFSDNKLFEKSSDVESYLSDKANRNKVGGVILENEKGEQHIANVYECTKKQIKFSGYDIYNEQGFTGGNIGTDGSSKKGWRIIGLLLD